MKQGLLQTEDTEAQVSHDTGGGQCGPPMLSPCPHRRGWAQSSSSLGHQHPGFASPLPLHEVGDQAWQCPHRCLHGMGLWTSPLRTQSPACAKDSQISIHGASLCLVQRHYLPRTRALLSRQPESFHQLYLIISQPRSWAGKGQG